MSPAEDCSELFRAHGRRCGERFAAGVTWKLSQGWAAMQRGTIKKLVADKGFGFIAGGQRGKDLFFHLSSLQDAEFDSLYEGQEVEYESEEGPKGARASVVRPVS
jgi:CspA family cold shock protein